MKERICITIDPDIRERLLELKNKKISTFVNDRLREVEWDE